MTAVARRPATAARIAHRIGRRIAHAALAACAGLAATGVRAADVVLSTAQAGTAASGAAAGHLATHTAPVISSGSSLAQAGMGLFAVIALILGIAWLARRVGLVRQGAGNASIKVVGSLMLGARQKIVTVEVAGTWLVLGVSPNEIRPLHTLPAQPDTGASAASLPSQPMHGGFGERLMRAMQENLKK
ncbi:flagellar biosynthetic protein FliO [Cupriavidus pauculus]|uniref:flagellar biosynthetic protein FliO n=1 Tax=Cupriavidus pauculus TaxID=82633 RepID=UPI0012466D9C|nr:flagellar biosynthetic protein FliO [Cupriavidus pauculus]KAB0601091.1 flagellar biosynthetic protein FliO [Cupriavidus pauculus]UAL02025.1 flagellar biosynthetic protein FliO [Cupriavidus pauculus]